MLRQPKFMETLYPVFDMIMQVFLSSDGLMVFGLFLLFCIIEDDLYDTMQCCAASLVLCQTTHL